MDNKNSFTTIFFSFFGCKHRSRFKVLVFFVTFSILLKYLWLCSNFKEITTRANSRLNVFKAYWCYLHQCIEKLQIMNTKHISLRDFKTSEVNFRGSTVELRILQVLAIVTSFQTPAAVAVTIATLSMCRLSASSTSSFVARESQSFWKQLNFLRRLLEYIV